MPKTGSGFCLFLKIDCKDKSLTRSLLAPNAPLRQAETARAGLPMGDDAVSANQMPVVAEDQSEAGSKTPSATAYLWAMLIARIYEVLDEIHPCISHYVQLSAAQIGCGRICPLVCPQCGVELKVVAN